jgi:hypothetical protein
MSTIDYDKPVEDFIDRLSATGHVTHESYKKTSVTLHHNAGNLTHAGCLSVWTTRPASAHFDVDAKGAVAQYVKVDEYAWATGSTIGNQSSISIEMADATFAPNWEVGEDTWKSAARLAAWLFYNVIHARPTASNLFPHRHWSSTACPGPWVVKNFNMILVEAQTQYDKFKAAGNPPAKEPTPSPTKKTAVELAKEVIAGKWGNGPDRTHRLLVAGYDPNAVQVEVNKILRGKPNPAQSSIAEIAREVIAGKWGNGSDRIARLTRAGYSPNAVQTEVNRLLR